MDSSTKNEINKLSNKVIGAAIEVHRNLGPGLLENVYEECLSHELTIQSINFKRQQFMPVDYKGLRVENSYRLDLVVEDKIIVEIKSVNSILHIHESQLLTYLKF